MDKINTTTDNYFKAMKEAGTEKRGGYIMAYRAYDESCYYNTGVFSVSELLRETEIDEFVQCLKEAGVKEFALIDGWSGLIERLHALNEAGCTIKGFTTVKQSTEYMEKIYKALIMQVA